MSDEVFMLESVHNTSRRAAVFEDDGTSGWLYLSGVGDRKPIADVWIHNRINAPQASEIANYRGGPPPAAAGFADDLTICHAPENHTWTFTWYEDGEAVVMHCDGVPIAMLIATEPHGWSRNLKRDGPWGNRWDEERYNAVTQKVI